MLDVMYQAYGGNLRRDWFVCRRAMVHAQMMHTHRSDIQCPLRVVDSSEPIYPNFIWYRIVYTDHQLRLMAGLPQGSPHVSMASEAALPSDTPSGRFKRKQTVIASCIPERKESSHPAIIDDFAVLQDIDAELQKAANEMPSSENVEAVTRLNTDVLSEHSSSLLKRLLSLKADAAATVTMDLYPHSATDDAQFLQIGIPYFGNVRISRDDAVSMGASPCATLPSPTRQRRVPANTVVFLPEIQASGCGHTVGQVDGRSDPGILTQIQPLLDEVASEMLLIPQEATWISSSAIKVPDLQACRPSATQLPIAINNALHPQEQTSRCSRE
ncbi:MAG: hypothetical protein Q9157_000376 [Trypethelium eluteriae]